MNEIMLDEWDEIRKQGKRIYAVVTWGAKYQIIPIDAVSTTAMDLVYRMHFPCFKNYFHAWAYVQKRNKWQEMKEQRKHKL